MNFFNTIFEAFSLNETIIKLVLTIVVFYLSALIRRQLSKFINDKIDSDSLAYKVNQTKNVIINVIVLIIFIQIWFSMFQSISTFLGLITAGIAIKYPKGLSKVFKSIFFNIIL